MILLKNFFFEYFKKRYQEILETKLKGSQFVFESVDLLYYSLHKISLNRGGSYIDSPEWLKNKKATINPKSKDNECFKYAIIAALNHERIKNHPERIFNLKNFIDQYKWKGIEFPSHAKDWKMFEQSNKTIALNIFYAPYNTEKKVWLAYKSKYNHKRDNQVFLLMITDDGKKWHCLAVKKSSALLKEITSNNHGDLKIKILNRFEKILKCNPGEKSLKVYYYLFLSVYYLF